MPTFRTKAIAVIALAGKQIGTIGGWVEHEIELGLEVLQELKALVASGTAAVQAFHPHAGWSDDVPVHVLDEMISAAQAADTAVTTLTTAAATLTPAPAPNTSEQDGSAEGAVSGGNSEGEGADAEASAPAVDAADPVSAGEPAAPASAGKPSKPKATAKG